MIRHREYVMSLPRDVGGPLSRVYGWHKPVELVPFRPTADDKQEAHIVTQNVSRLATQIIRSIHWGHVRAVQQGANSFVRVDRHTMRGGALKQDVTKQQDAMEICIGPSARHGTHIRLLAEVATLGLFDADFSLGDLPSGPLDMLQADLILDRPALPRPVQRWPLNLYLEFTPDQVLPGVDPDSLLRWDTTELVTMNTSLKQACNIE